MFINFAKKLFEILVSDEFSYIKQVDDRLIYETGALSLYKDKGSILYIVSIINAENIDMEKYEAIIKHYSSLLGGSSKAQVILMNVIADDFEGKLLWDEDYLPGKASYVFSYNVNLETKELSVPDEQPELLGLFEKVKTALYEKGEEYVNGMSLSSLEDELYEKYALPVKSGNIYLTYSLIVLCTVIWALTELAGSSSDTWTLISFGALSRNLVFNLNEYYRLFTAMFLHIGAAHLANNCLALYIYGSRVERYFGKLMFVVIFITAGIVGNIVTVLLMPNLSAGASGAIFGLLGALLSVTYRTGRSISNLSPYLILLLCISSIGMGFLNSAVNNYAHVAGFITGVIMGRLTFRKS